ncbi:CxxH/CxxC protein [Bacillus kexueae]|uniref:CxxH/CxxC protein n=1 Tax=Aeribacillus kexueae TaxID=2078952 RepID=UPI001FB02B87|nr:CxxH/CxxC protein [Bacillus kexueae]
MKACIEHIEVVIDMFVDENEIAPNIQKIEDNHSLSTTCDLCNNPAVYIVSES